MTMRVIQREAEGDEEHLEGESDEGHITRG